MKKDDRDDLVAFFKVLAMTAAVACFYWGLFAFIGSLIQGK